MVVTRGHKRTNGVFLNFIMGFLHETRTLHSVTVSVGQSVRLFTARLVVHNKMMITINLGMKGKQRSLRSHSVVSLLDFVIFSLIVQMYSGENIFGYVCIATSS